MHVNNKMILGLLMSCIFILGSVAAPVSALQANMVTEEFNQAFAPGMNNHTYAYVDANPLYFASASRLHLNEDLDYTRYSYDNTGWARTTGSLTSPENPQFNWQPYQGFLNGPFGNPTNMPVFFDFIGSDGSGAVINTTLERRTFSLALGQTTPVIMEGGFTYFGTLALSGQEFIHLTIDSRQDGVSWSVGVIDPEGRYITSISGSGGDILVAPFRPSVAGTYYVILNADNNPGTYVMFDLLPVAVAATPIAINEVVEGTLPTGELVVKSDTGSLVHQELAPTVRTYKVTSPTDVASVTYAFNYPELMGTTQTSGIQFTSDAFVYSYDGGSRYQQSITSPSNGVYYYTDGPIYVTIFGGDNIEYTIYHKDNGGVNLPLNHEFLLENEYANSIQKAYRLSVEQDSLLKANSTGAGGDYNINVRGVNEAGYYTSQSIVDSATLELSANYYLPKGDYVVLITVASTTSEYIEFSFAPIIDGYTADLVRLGGFKVPTNPCTLYNLTVHLDTLDNISAGISLGVYDESYRNVWGASFTLANWWDGSHWIPHPSGNSTTALVGSSWSDDYAFVTMSISIWNNTGALVQYEDYPATITIEWQDYTDEYYNGVVTLDIRETADSNNFTLEFPGVSTEYYYLQMNTTLGTWYNVTLRSADVSSCQATLYSHYDARTHSVAWTDLNDELTGPWPSDGSFQFGAISDSAVLTLQVGRSLIDVGYLWIEITPMETNHLEWLEPLGPAGPDLLGLIGGIAIPVAIGAGVIVVVYIVYVKKFKK
jgi:hypothetical protein